MQATHHLTSVLNRAANDTGVPPETIHYYVGRDRLLDDGKWFRSEQIAGPFYEAKAAQVARATCGDESAHVVKVTTFVQAAIWAATYTSKACHGFDFDMRDGTTQFFTAQEVLQAPWYAALPADDRAHIEHWAAHFKRHGWDA